MISSDSPQEGSSSSVAKATEGIRDVFAKTGHPLPDGMAAVVPTVDLRKPVEVVAAEVGRYLGAHRLLFRRRREPGTIDPKTGDWVPMDATRFVTWVPEQGLAFRKGVDNEGNPKIEDLPEQKARQLLSSDRFLRELSEIQAINLIPLPIFRSALDERGDPKRKGFRKMELLPEGYDPESGVFTLSGRGYSQTKDPEEAKAHQELLFKYFPFTDPSRKAVQYAASLTCYCKHLFEGRSPMFVWNSQGPSAGKGALCALAVRPVDGDVGAVPFNPREEKNLKDLLDSIAQEAYPVLFFDEAKGKVQCNELNLWLINSTRAGRIFHKQRLFRAKVRTITVMTGAGLKFDDHLERRSLFVNLAPVKPPNQRVFPEDVVLITEPWLCQEENLKEIREDLWALVTAWDDLGRPAGRRGLESFESWAAIIPGMVFAVTGEDCLARLEADNAGGVDSYHWSKLLELAVQKHGEAGRVGVAELIVLARLNGLFPDVVGEVASTLVDLDTRRLLPPSGWDEMSEGERVQYAAKQIPPDVTSRFGKKLSTDSIPDREFSADGVDWKIYDRKRFGAGIYMPLRRLSDVG